MASIYGVQIKNLKPFRDHEGMTIYQGDIWMDGKKLGGWSQSYMGGVCDDFDFNTKALDDRAMKYLNTTDEKYKSTEMFLSVLVEKTLDEKEYKKIAKKGYKTYVRVSGNFGHIGYMTMEDKDEILKSDYHKNILDKVKKQFCFKDVEPKTETFDNAKAFVIEDPDKSKKRIQIEKE